MIRQLVTRVEYQTLGQNSDIWRSMFNCISQPMRWKTRNRFLFPRFSSAGATTYTLLHDLFLLETRLWTFSSSLVLENLHTANLKISSMHAQRQIYLWSSWRHSEETINGIEVDPQHGKRLMNQNKKSEQEFDGLKAQIKEREQLRIGRKEARSWTKYSSSQVGIKNHNWYHLNQSALNKKTEIELQKKWEKLFSEKETSTLNKNRCCIYILNLDP